MKKKTEIIVSLILSSIILLSCSSNKKETTESIPTIEKKQSQYLQVGDTIPKVLGVDENNQIIHSENYKGKKIILYFYPKDETPGCTTQACNLRDNYQNLLDHDYVIFGVSTDSVTSHKEFITNHKLPFSLIADTDTTLIKQFGAINNGRPTRTTFIINENGIIKDIIEPSEINVSDHTIQILNFNN